MKMAEIAEQDAKLGLVWSPGSAADKYKIKFWPVFGKGKWSWCAARVTWCAEQAGLKMPVKCPDKFGFTFALVEAWQQWAEAQGFYIDNDGKFVPQRGDISIFDWTQTNIDDPDKNWDDHIGIHLGMVGANYLCSEGNTNGGRVANKIRKGVNIQGWIRIPDGYVFPEST